MGNRFDIEEPQRVTVSFSLPGLGLLVFLILMILKVTGVATQVPWFWIWFCLWFPWALILGIFIIALIIIGIVALVEG